ncbi:glucose/arabinose dehydrogenase [Kibdelosporangium banguiense]|uniref:Glucose/arabinose dehydrogenase n=1 Tax=Kibdelosporangium banguiense TaxID=1365924 RepID=A0ABS4T8L9_9PSEU|nr:PQQ-dependent sugar dehydrogenase [Kibdelosporangium banguiense]MBP2320274.1 glucose/arabinose dehydrogenase [Kibdelosporangium banguiense]
MPRRYLSIAVPLVVAVLLAPPALADDAPILDPIPEKPITSGIALTLQELATMPKSDPEPPVTDVRLRRHARINYLGEVPDGSGRLYVPDLNGKLYLLKNGQTLQYLDVGATVGPNFFNNRGLGTGFGFVTFHPDFARNGRFYTTHSEAKEALTTKPADFNQPGNIFVQSVVTEWTATNPAADTFSGTRREILRIGFTGQIHAIQQVDFNPTALRHQEDYGKLYIAVGDGGRGVTSDDPQNLALPHGKLIRIDPDGRNSRNGKYGIPVRNPFVGRAGALGEIYAYGFRDPHRFSWDTLTRKLYLGSIGEHEIEAVYEVRAGDNFGWSDREGPFVFKRSDRCNLYPLPANDAQFGYTYPVAAFDHDPPPNFPCTSDSGHAVVGGFVYRGSQIPELWGKYIFGDLVDGRLFYTNSQQMRRGAGLAPLYQLSLVDGQNRPMTMQDFAGDKRTDIRFGTNAAGDLFILAKANGKIWKVTGTKPLPDVYPSLTGNLVAHYDFEHPAGTAEADQGRSGTNIELINGASRVSDGAFPGSRNSLQVKQVNPTTAGNDDWKAGIYSASGVPTLRAFNGVGQTTVMGWVKMTGQNPSPNSNSANPGDFYSAIGIAGVLSGNSDGHAVRALLELIEVDGVLKVVALGRRIDGSASQTFAATEDWRTILPPDEWVFLTATFDFNTGAMALYKNGRPLAGSYVVTGDPWGIGTGQGPYVSSPTDPRGIKIGGSFPQNTREGNPCNCRFDSLMFLNRAVEPWEVASQYALTKN